MATPTFLTLVVLLPIGIGACSRATTRGLTLAGSTSVQPFAEKWADAYRARRPGLPIHVQGGGSTAGVQAAISGAAQIGMSSRPLTAEEARQGTAITVARDGIAIVVHPTNPVDDLVLDQLRVIYAGATRSWDQLGGRHGSITVITREEGSGTRSAFEALVMGGSRIAASALVQDSTGAVRQMVAADPAAIGYVSLGLVDASVKALRLHGVDASEATVDAGTYPLVRPFVFILPPGVPGETARDFISWITGPEGRDLTRREGLLPPGT
jgi:phosphate transport system substrate-binding protein